MKRPNFSSGGFVKSYQYIFFDWDGCLAKTLEIWFGAIESSLIDYNIQHSGKDVARLMNDLYGGVIGLGMRQDQYIQFKNDVYSRAEASIAEVYLYEGASVLLKSLKSKGKKLALISSGSKPSLERMLQRTRTNAYFDLVISGSDVEKRKPSPEGIESALAKLGAQKESSIMVGDSEHDLDAARNAGIDSVLFYPDAHTSFYNLDDLRKSNPTYTIRTFSELSRILDP